MKPTDKSNLFLFLEAIDPKKREEIANAKPTDVITVYHGTTPLELARMINGFDARQVYRRVYGGGEHRGVFVAPDFDSAGQFGSGAVIEIKTYAKFLHGTDWSGVTGRDVTREKGQSALDWVKEKFPNSFRPWMSYTLLSNEAEPQALLMGLVKPSQITRVWIRPPGKEQWQEYSREEYLQSKPYYNAVYRGGAKPEYEYFFDAGIDMADPNLKLEDFVKALAKFEGREGREQSYIDYLKRLGKIGKDRLEDKLQYIEIGGSRLGELAFRNIVKQVMKLVKEDETTSESRMPIDILLNYLSE